VARSGGSANVVSAAHATDCTVECYLHPQRGGTRRDDSIEINSNNLSDSEVGEWMADLDRVLGS
jgi:hypothetical protein